MCEWQNITLAPRDGTQIILNTKTWGEIRASFFPGGFCEGGEDELGPVMEHPCWLLENDFLIESILINQYEYEDLDEIIGFKI